MKLFSLLVFVFAAQSTFANTLKIGISHLSHQAFPSIIKQVESALNHAGIRVEFVEMPAVRLLQALPEGLVDMDMYRQPSAFASSDQVIQISRPVDQHHLYLLTHPSNRSFCDLGKQDLKHHSIAGVIGVKLYEDFVYPYFNWSTEVINFDQVIQLIDRKRVDFGLAPKQMSLEAQTRMQTDLHVCDQKAFKSLKFYSYLHKKHEALLPLIEQSYAQHFKNTGKNIDLWAQAPHLED